MSLNYLSLFLSLRLWQWRLDSELNLDTELEDFTDGREEALAFEERRAEPDFTPVCVCVCVCACMWKQATSNPLTAEKACSYPAAQHCPQSWLLLQSHTWCIRGPGWRTLCWYADRCWTKSPQGTAWTHTRLNTRDTCDHTLRPIHCDHTAADPFTLQIRISTFPR